MTGLMVKNDTTSSSFHTNRPGMSPLMIMLKTDAMAGVYGSLRSRGRWPLLTWPDTGQPEGVAAVNLDCRRTSAAM